MEKELNIAAILNEKPTETKLWSPMLGDCIYCYNNTYPEEIIIAFTDKNGEEKEWTFSYSGRTISAPDTADVCLFPSKQMRDWHKFAWKKGDVLVNSRGLKILFDRWANDNYTSFYAKTINLVEDAFLDTNLHTLASEKEAKSFIKCIEEKLGGKLNLETLEIEHPKQEFKDGDIVTLKIPNLEKDIRIFKEVVNKKMHENHYYVGFNFDDDGRPIQIFKDYYAYTDNERPATDSEKQQLFSALAKEGKRWNPDTKQIEDLPKKCEFKPMDWCLMRDVDEVEYRGFVTSEWVLCQFSHYLEGYKFVAVGGNWFGECIPYNEETAHLLGTTDEWKGGEG